MISNSEVFCAKEKCKFYQKEEVKDLLDSIDNEKESKLVLDKLFQLYKVLKKLAFELDNLGDIPAKDGCSHAKVLYLEELTNHGTLKFECMYFTGDCYTALHTHPEYVIDELIDGELIEDEFELRNDEYISTNQIKRVDNDLRKSFDPSGLPHRVCAAKDGATTLCLSLGKNKVKMLPN